MIFVKNPCIRCGKQRIVVKTKRELINGSWVTTTTTRCPDPDCQRIVEKQLKKDNDAREMLISQFKNLNSPFNRRSDIVLGKRKKNI